MTARSEITIFETINFFNKKNNDTKEKKREKKGERGGKGKKRINKYVISLFCVSAQYYCKAYAKKTKPMSTCSRISGALESAKRQCRLTHGPRLQRTRRAAIAMYTRAEGSSRPVSSSWASIIFRIRTESVTVKVRIITPAQATACCSHANVGDQKPL